MICMFMFFFFKQKTAYEMRISDWSSDVCSSDLHRMADGTARRDLGAAHLRDVQRLIVVVQDFHDGGAGTGEMQVAGTHDQSRNDDQSQRHPKGEGTSAADAVVDRADAPHTAHIGRHNVHPTDTPGNHYTQ